MKYGDAAVISCILKTENYGLQLTDLTVTWTKDGAVVAADITVSRFLILLRKC